MQTIFGYNLAYVMYIITLDGNVIMTVLCKMNKFCGAFLCEFSVSPLAFSKKRTTIIHQCRAFPILIRGALCNDYLLNVLEYYEMLPLKFIWNALDFR